jgi:hypothetical protein
LDELAWEKIEGVEILLRAWPKSEGSLCIPGGGPSMLIVGVVDNRICPREGK